MKTERITILSTPRFKSFLTKEAEKEGVTLSELVRQRCELPAHQIDDDEVMLRELITEVRNSTVRAKTSLEKGLMEATATLKAIRENKDRECH